MSGRKMSCPVALPAVRMPLTSPRRWTYHRLEIVATKVIDIEPVPAPTTMPHRSMSCHGAFMKIVSPLPRARAINANVTTRRTPKRSMSAAAKGEMSPKSTRLTETAAPIVP